MRSLQAWTTIVQWRWAPFAGLVVGTIFINLVIVLIVPARIDTAAKSTPAANVLTRPGISDDDGEESPFGAAPGATAARPRHQRGLPGFGNAAGPFGGGAPSPVQPFAAPPPPALPPPPVPPPPPVAVPPPPEPEPPAPPPPPVVPEPAALPHRMMAAPLKMVRPGEAPAAEQDDDPDDPPHAGEAPPPPGAVPPPPAPPQ